MKRKYIIIAGCLTFMLAIATACGNDTKSGEPNTLLPSAEKVEENANVQNPGDNPGANTDTPKIPATDGKTPKAPGADGKTPETQTANNETSENGSSITTIPDSTFIGGAVRSVSQDSFVISRTLTEDFEDGSYIASMPEAGSPEEELVTIRCTDATTFEHWTIQGGGADITRKEASFSDILENEGLVEASGYFEGDTFIADKVIIELYQ